MASQSRRHVAQWWWLSQLRLLDTTVLLPWLPAAGLNVVGQVAVAFQPPKCNTYPDQAGGMDIPPTEDGHGTILPQDLPDMRSHHTGMPQTLDHKHFMKAEGATYYWYAAGPAQPTAP